MKTRHRALASVMAVAIIFLSTPAWAARDPELTRAMALVAAGDLDEASSVLDRLIRRLAKGAATPDLAEAHLYMGVTHSMLSSEAKVQGEFREALKLNPNLTLAPDRWSPRVLKSFAAAREAFAGTGGARPPGPPRHWSRRHPSRRGDERVGEGLPKHLDWTG